MTGRCIWVDTNCLSVLGFSPSITCKTGKWSRYHGFAATPAAATAASAAMPQPAAPTPAAPPASAETDDVGAPLRTAGHSFQSAFRAAILALPAASRALLAPPPAIAGPAPPLADAAPAAAPPAAERTCHQARDASTENRTGHVGAVPVVCRPRGAGGQAGRLGQPVLGQVRSGGGSRQQASGVQGAGLGRNVFGSHGV